MKELAETWSFSANVIRRLFRDEPGVLRIGNGKHESLSIPDSIAARVHARISAPRVCQTVRLRELGIVRTGPRRKVHLRELVQR